MNQEQVIEWAREAGTWEYAATREEKVAQYMRFAALVAADAAAKEREACAQACESIQRDAKAMVRDLECNGLDDGVSYEKYKAGSAYIEAIRARGNKEGV